MKVFKCKKCKTEYTNKKAKRSCYVCRARSIAWRDKAREIWERFDNDLEIDDDAKANINENGVWVQAWVWVSKEEDDDDEQIEGKQSVSSGTN